MNVITVSREFGAGGSEVGRRLAKTLGWELLDRELLHQAAAVEHVPDADLEGLDEKAISMGLFAFFSGRFSQFRQHAGENF